MSETTNSVSNNFDSGASYLISDKNYQQYVAGEGAGLIGRPDGQFVAPSNEMDEVLLKANGDPRIMEEMLGSAPGSLGDSPKRVNILNPEDYNLRLPDASISGSNENFITGGKTSGAYRRV